MNRRWLAVPFVVFVLLMLRANKNSTDPPAVLEVPTNTAVPTLTIEPVSRTRPVPTQTLATVVMVNPTITTTVMKIITFVPLDTVAPPLPSSVPQQTTVPTQLIPTSVPPTSTTEFKPIATQLPAPTATLMVNPTIVPVVVPTATPVPAEIVSDNVYYLALDGNNDNSGTIDQPWRTWEYAKTVLQPGDTLRLHAGTYEQRFKIEIDGLTLEAAGERPVINGPHNIGPSVWILSNGVTVRGLEVINTDTTCLRIDGAHGLIEDNVIHNCKDMGLLVEQVAHDIVVRDNAVYRAALVNESRSSSGGWPSGLKVRGATNVLVENNIVYHNWGEGIAARGFNLIIRNNVAYDNFSFNIYSGHPVDTVIEGNLSFCTTNGDPWYRNGNPPNGIGVSEETFSDMQSQLKNVTIVNNIIDGCFRGIVYGGSESSGGGLDHALIAHNTLVNIQERGIYIADEPAKTQNVVIANNLVQAGTRGAVIRASSGVTCHHNLWVNGDNTISCSGVGDITGDALLNGQYVPQVNSPVIDAGEDVGITVDYFGNVRSNPPNIGALE